MKVHILLAGLAIGPLFVGCGGSALDGLRNNVAFDGGCTPKEVVFLPIEGKPEKDGWVVGATCGAKKGQRWKYNAAKTKWRPYTQGKDVEDNKEEAQ